MRTQLPDQRWYIADSQPEIVAQLVAETGVSPLIARVMANRGIDSPNLAQAYIDPECELLPAPIEEFPDLGKSIELLKTAIADREKIAICGDYDADGMTSTALLIRALRHLGAEVDYAIPSRMKDGYGINKRIVTEFAQQGVGLILTVDNGISALKPIELAIELGLSVIITDHHDLPEILPPADAILNPKLIPETSPYRGLAGVGVAYILAVTLAQQLDAIKGLTHPLLELFTLGTIADLAPLTGVNRRWLKRGLQRLPNSELVGIQELMKVAGVSDQQKSLRPDDIGFRLGPRINAVGRIGDPQVVIDLLTTDDPGVALEKAMICEQINTQRQHLCEEIFAEAVLLIAGETADETLYNWQKDRVLVIVQPDWHHGVIGIVASRLVERYGAPVFIGTYEDKDNSIIRGSARGIPEFNVHKALVFCDDLLGKYGGHKAAGGFNLKAENLTLFQQRLSEFAHECLQPEQLKPLVQVDSEASFQHLNTQFFQQIDSLHPWGIGNAEPVFWTASVQVLEQKIVGKNHLKLVVAQNLEGNWVKMKAIAWRWGEYFPLPQFLDFAYKLQENRWNDSVTIELEIVGARAATGELPSDSSPTPSSQKALFDYNGRSYRCHLVQDELRIKNPQGKVLAVTRGQRTGLLGMNRDAAEPVDVTRSPYYEIIKTAMAALNQGKQSSP
jgi:single-stranded-DNA-specific exonuclease